MTTTHLLPLKKDPQPHHCHNCGERYWRCQKLHVWVQIRAGQRPQLVEIAQCFKCHPPAQAHRMLTAAHVSWRTRALPRAATG